MVESINRKKDTIIFFFFLFSSLSLYTYICTWPSMPFRAIRTFLRQATGFMEEISNWTARKLLRNATLFPCPIVLPRKNLFVCAFYVLIKSVFQRVSLPKFACKCCSVLRSFVFFFFLFYFLLFKFRKEMALSWINCTIYNRRICFFFILFKNCFFFGRKYKNSKFDEINKWIFEEIEKLRICFFFYIEYQELPMIIFFKKFKNKFEKLFKI